MLLEEHSKFKFAGAAKRTRTSDLLLRRQTLYPLSYGRALLLYYLSARQGPRRGGDAADQGPTHVGPCVFPRPIHFAFALRALLEQWRRSVLSATGVMVGAVAVFLLVGIATGVQSDLRRQVEDIGVNVLIVIPGRIEDGTFNPNLGGASYLREEDADRLAKVAGVIRTAPWTFVGGGVRNGKKTAPSVLAATTEAWFQMRPQKVVEGRTLLPADDTRDVCVIGSVAKQSLFGDTPAVGKPLTINGKPYTVVGVTEEQKKDDSLFSMVGFQNLVYLPYHRLKANQTDLQTDRLMIQIAPDAEPKALLKKLDAVIGERLDRQQYQVLTQEQLLGLAFRLMNILTWLLTGLTSIALFVAGVGIMAVMTMSVNERIYEIGIRKTLGARRTDIFWQFLLEAILLTVSGVVFAIILSEAVCLLLEAFTPIHPLLNAPIITLGLTSSLFVGTLFGVLPAANGARLTPIECMAKRNS